MSFYEKDGIGFSTSGGMFIMQNDVHPLYKDSPNTEGKIIRHNDPLNGNPWAPWGMQNNMPAIYSKYLDGCSTLYSGIDTRSRFAIAKGLIPMILLSRNPQTGEEETEYCNDPEILDFLEENDEYLYAYGLTNDSLKYGWDCTKILFNRGRTKITRFERADVTTMRLGKANPATGLIENVYQSWDWQSGRSYDDKNDWHVKLPLLQPGREWQDLQQRKDGYEFAIINRNVGNERFYYPVPMWWAAKIWIEIAMEIPLYKQATYKNQMSIKYVATISPHYWNNNVPGYSTMTPEEKKKVRAEKMLEIDRYLVGSPNAHKTLFTGSYIDPASGKPVNDIQIEVLDDKMKDGKMLPDSSAAEKHILYAIQMNPAISGNNLMADGASGGAGSGSDIREATLVQIMINEFERRKASRLFNIIKRVNGWQDRFKSKGQLVFRYPSSVLTTLDTGKSTKEEKM